jgi:hypothetical protein
MKQLALTKQQILGTVVWQPTGKSPGNTPQAKLQTAQLLMQMSVNPATGIDAHELATVIIANGALANAGNIQLSKEQMRQNAAAQQQQQQIQQSGAPGGPDQGPSIPPNAGGPSAAGLPVAQQGPGYPPTNQAGPAPIPEPSIKATGPY